MLPEWTAEQVRDFCVIFSPAFCCNLH